jgi:hypothetical protein
MKFYIHKENGYCPCIRTVDESLNDLSTINMGIASMLAEQAWNNALLKDSFKYAIYAPALQKEEVCIIADLPVKYIIIKNYNGYTTLLVKENDERTGEMSIEEYREWNKNHVAKWINDTWVYEKR